MLSSTHDVTPDSLLQQSHLRCEALERNFRLDPDTSNATFDAAFRIEVAACQTDIKMYACES